MSTQSAEAFDILKNNLRAETGPWDRLPILVELATSRDFKEPDFARQCATEALNLAKELNDPFWIAASMWAVGVSLLGTSRYSEILFYLEGASERFGQLNDPRMKAKADIELAALYVAMREFAKAVPLLSTVLPAFQSMGNAKKVANVYMLFGEIHEGTGDWGKAIEYYNRALDLLHQANLESITGTLYQYLAVAYRKLEDHEMHRHYLFKSLAVQRQYDNKRGIAVAVSNVANMYLDKQQFAQAEQYVRESRDLYHTLGYVAQEALSWGKMASIHNSRGDRAEVFRCYRIGIALCKNCENKLALGKLYETLGAICHTMGYPRHTLTYFLKALAFLEKHGELCYLHQIHRMLGEIYEELGISDKALYHLKEYERIKEETAGIQKCFEASYAEREYEVRKLLEQVEEEESRSAKLKEMIREKETRLVSLTLELVRIDESKKNADAGDADSSADTGGAARPENWDVFARQFHQVYHGFYPDLLKRFPELTPAEIKVCSLIKTGLSSRKIAGILGISRRTVDNHRARIHKKMDLPQGASLTGFLARM